MSEKLYIETGDIPRKVFNGLGTEIFQSMKKYAENTAMICSETGTNIKYKVILEKSIRTAINLRAENMGNEPIIGICVGNHSDSFIPLFASYFLGYKVVTFDGTISIKDTVYLLKEVISPVIMFIDDLFVEMMENSMEIAGSHFELIVIGKNEKYRCYETEFLRKNPDEEANFKPVNLKSNKETALFLFSSGTTGLPKGICTTHKGLFTHTENLIFSQKITSNSVINNVISLVWLTSHLMSLASIFTGAKIVTAPLTELWKAINDFKITHIYMSPYLSSLLIKQEKSQNWRVDSVISFFTGGAKLNDELKENLRKLLPNTLIADSYGQTEVSGWITMFRVGDENDEKLARKNNASVGKPCPGMILKVVDNETGKLLGPNEIGELRIKNDGNLMNGYYKKDSSSEFDSEGWLKTGDLVYYDEDKCIYIVGRCKELLKYRNFHIQPQMLEQILNAHPAVDKSLVIGVNHKIDGNHPLGLVVLHDGQEVSPEDLEKYVEDRVQERQRLRAGVKIIKEILLTVSGKLKRAEMKRMYEQGLL